MSYMEDAHARILVDEGCELLPYKDTKGNMTIGVGHNLLVPFPIAVVYLLFDYDLREADHTARRFCSTFETLADARKSVLVNMAFNLGAELFNFHKFQSCIAAGDWAGAAREMLDSDWARQVGARAARLAARMRTGQ